MKRTIEMALVVLVVGVAAWSVYAYAQGNGPLKQMAPAVCQPACEFSTQPCENTPICHEGSVCDPTGCPKFQDNDGDGRCDIIGDCGRCGQPDHHDEKNRCGVRMTQGCSSGCGR